MLTVILLVMSGLFIAALLTKRLLSIKLCALCVAVLLTWVSLFVLYRAGRFHDKVLLSLLMGQSVTGIFYFLKKRVTPALRIFTLPFFLTLTTVFYFAVALPKSILPPLLVLLGLWIAAYVVFSYRNDPGKKQVTDAVMNCCEDK